MQIYFPLNIIISPFYRCIIYVYNSILSIPFYLVLQAPETKSTSASKLVSNTYIKKKKLNLAMTQRKHFYHIHRINKLSPRLPL